MKRLCPALILSVMLVSCGSGDRDDSVATVNGAPISLKEYRKELKNIERMTPGLVLTGQSAEEALDAMIDRKLLMQEAVKRGLSEDPRFVETIKSYWEQTLFRELVGAKTKEWGAAVSVTDDEVERHYSRLKFSVTIRSSKAAGEKELEEKKEAMRANRRIPGEVIEGPLYAENYSPGDALLPVFDLEKGGLTVIKDIDGITVIQVLKKTPSKTPPLDEIRERIRRHLIDFKIQKAMEDWLRGVKKASAIKVNKDAVEKAGGAR